MANKTIKALAEISAIRLLQTQAAEMNVLQAGAALEQRIGERDDMTAEERRLDSRWTHAVGAGSIDLGMSQVWAHAVSQNGHSVRQATVALDVARDDHSSMAAAWRSAQARAKAANEIMFVAKKKAQRRREELANAETSDSFGHRSWYGS